MAARLLIVGDERKGTVHALLGSMTSWLDQRGAAHDVVLDRDASLETRDGDVVVVLGGDGSILAAARRMGRNQRPTLGINLGRLGFLTAFSDADALEALRLVLEGELVEETRLMLTCRVRQRSGEVGESTLFLNDAVLHGATGSGIIRIIARRTDRELGAYTGDGLIVSTPVGSTAYSLAAGGPIVSPRLDAIVLTPLASHSISLRPLVLPVGNGVQLQLMDAGGRDTCSLAIDGQITKRVTPEDVVEIEPAAVRFRHLTRGPGQFFAVLRRKFGWADEPRRSDSNQP